MQNRLGIAVAVETVAQRFQLLAQLQMVVDFAVEDDDGVAVVGLDGLVAACQIDDLQAGRAQRAEIGTEDALLVGSAMGEGGGGGLNAVRTGRPVLMGKSDNATQNAETPALSNFRLPCNR